MFTSHFKIFTTKIYLSKFVLIQNKNFLSFIIPEASRKIKVQSNNSKTVKAGKQLKGKEKKNKLVVVNGF